MISIHSVGYTEDGDFGVLWTFGDEHDHVSGFYAQSQAEVLEVLDFIRKAVQEAY